MIAGWINRHQQQVITYLLEENRTLHTKDWSINNCRMLWNGTIVPFW
jgi:hypothetical protein